MPGSDRLGGQAMQGGASSFQSMGGRPPPGVAPPPGVSLEPLLSIFGNWARMVAGLESLRSVSWHFQLLCQYGSGMQDSKWAGPQIFKLTGLLLLVAENL